MKNENDIFVFYTTTNLCCFNALLSKNENLLSQYLKKKILSYKFLKDKALALYGILLLQMGLKHFKYPLSYIKKLKHTNHGKPYINYDFEFNISHSSNMTVCAFSKNNKLGIDLQKKKNIELKNFKNNLNDSIYSEIKSSKNPHETFFNYWTKLESLLKADGRGFFIDSKNIYFQDNKGFINKKQQYFISKINLHDDFICHIAHEKKNSSITIEKKFFT